MIDQSGNGCGFNSYIVSINGNIGGQLTLSEDLKSSASVLGLAFYDLTFLLMVILAGFQGNHFFKNH